VIASKQSWTEGVPKSFTGGCDGVCPPAGVIGGLSGHLYGTTFGGGHGQGLQADGVVFEVVP